MFKKLLLVVLIFLFSAGIAVAGCVLPEGTDVMRFTDRGLSRTIPTMDRPVAEVSRQPGATLLMEFSGKANEDWTDGVVVFDQEYGIFLLVHEKDLVGECDIIEK